MSIEPIASRYAIGGWAKPAADRGFGPPPPPDALIHRTLGRAIAREGHSQSGRPRLRDATDRRQSGSPTITRSRSRVQVDNAYPFDNVWVPLHWRGRRVSVEAHLIHVEVGETGTIADRVGVYLVLPFERLEEGVV